MYCTVHLRTLPGTRIKLHKSSSSFYPIFYSWFQERVQTKINIRNQRYSTDINNLAPFDRLQYRLINWQDFLWSFTIQGILHKPTPTHCKQLFLHLFYFDQKIVFSTNIVSSFEDNNYIIFYEWTFEIILWVPFLRVFLLIKLVQKPIGGHENCAENLNRCTVQLPR